MSFATRHLKGMPREKTQLFGHSKARQSLACQSLARASTIWGRTNGKIISAFDIVERSASRQRLARLFVSF